MTRKKIGGVKALSSSKNGPAVAIEGHGVTRLERKSFLSVCLFTANDRRQLDMLVTVAERQFDLLFFLIP